MVHKKMTKKRNKIKGSKLNKKARVLWKIYYLGNKYTARVFHPLAFEKGVYTVDIRKIGTSWVDRNEYFTQVMAKSPLSAVKKVINTPDFKRWQEYLEKRIKAGKEKTGYLFGGWE